MKKSIIVLIGLVLLTSLITIAIYQVYLPNTKQQQSQPPPRILEEPTLRLTPFVNGTTNALFVKIDQVTRDINITKLSIISSETKETVVTQLLSVNLLKDESVTIKIEKTMYSGKYEISISSTSGYSYRENFSVP